MLEFALLAPVFFLMISGLLEFVLYQFKINALNYVTYEAARNLQTGEVALSADPVAAFEDEVCRTAGVLLDCNAIVFDVRAYDQISDIQFPEVVFDEDGNPTNFVFQLGDANEYSAVRASLAHNFVTPFMSELFQIGPDLPAIVSSYAIVRNEPWN